MKMLELRHVDYSIQGKTILHDVNFEVNEQETLAILGASGSGKSTILRMIMGLIQPESGEVLVRGTDITRVSYRELVDLRRQMGIVFQEGALFDSLTVGENVGYYLTELQGMTLDQVEPRVRAMLKMVDLEETIDMMPEELSGGMSRRVSIARTMIYQPDLILYDEPTTGLDPLAARNIIELINRLKHDRHVTSIIVSHAIEDVASLADRFVVIRSGDVVWAADREEFLARKEAIVSAFYH